jgi:hypothetical protein
LYPSASPFFIPVANKQKFSRRNVEAQYSSEEGAVLSGGRARQDDRMLGIHL